MEGHSVEVQIKIEIPRRRLGYIMFFNCRELEYIKQAESLFNVLSYGLCSAGKLKKLRSVVELSYQYILLKIVFRACARCML